MKYLTKFKTQEEYNDYSKSPKADLKRRISLVGAKVVYDNENEPFYIEAIDDIIIDVVTLQNYEYSFDTIVWNSIADILNVPAGEKVYLRPKEANGWRQIHVTGRYNVGGRFYYVSGKIWNVRETFKGEIDLISAENLIMERTGKSLFEDCVNLIKGPRIISDKYINLGTLDYLFRNCTNLVESPTIIPGNDYNGEQYRYQINGLFYGCSNLKKITFLGEIPGPYYSNWLTGIAPDGLFVLSHQLHDNELKTGWEVKMYDMTNNLYYIKFPFGNTTTPVWYTSDDNMTWAEWVLSKHNFLQWTVNDTNVLSGDGRILMLGDIPVAPTDIIKRIVGSIYEFKTPTETTEE